MITDICITLIIETVVICITILRWKKMDNKKVGDIKKDEEQLKGK